jgi:dTMP kinase
MFISFEGIDGSGKSTQLVLLRGWFEGKGRSTVTIREPGATYLSEAIRDILLSNKQSITATAELLLFSAARVQLVETVIQTSLERGDVVLCDRYVDSTTAYQGYGRQLNLESVKICNSLATRGVMPVLTFFIDVPYNEAQTRMQFHASLAKPDRIESSGPDFFERVRNGYLAIAAKEPSRFIVINGVQERAAIHKDIVSIIEGRLNLMN